MNSCLFITMFLFIMIILSGNIVETFRGRHGPRHGHHHRPHRPPYHRPYGPQHRPHVPHVPHYYRPVIIKRRPLWYYWSDYIPFYSCKDGCTPEGCAYPDMNNPNSCVWASDCWGC